MLKDTMDLKSLNSNFMIGSQHFLNKLVQVTGFVV